MVQDPVRLAIFSNSPRSSAATIEVYLPYRNPWYASTLNPESRILNPPPAALPCSIHDNICCPSVLRHKQGGFVGRVILVADDSPIIQRKAQQILEDKGFEVETVSNGVAAVKKLPALRPVLVLADVSMPGKDGYEVCEFVKTSAQMPRVPVLLVGSDLEPYDEERGAKVKADGIIKKPFSPHELIAMVTKFVGLGGASAPQISPEGTQVVESSQERQGPNSQVAEEARNQEDEEAASQLAEDHGPTEHADWILIPQLDDSSTALGMEPEPAAPFPERSPDRTPETSPEPFLVVPENSRGVEESSGREVRDSGGTEAEELAPPKRADIISPTEPLDSCAPLVAMPAPDLFAPEQSADAATGGAPEHLLSGPDTGPEVEELRSREVVELRSPEAVEPGNREVFESTSVEAGLATAPLRRSPSLEHLGTSTSQLQDSSESGLLYRVVHRVVTRMAPPFLAPEQVEELARLLTREIAEDLKANPT